MPAFQPQRLPSQLTYNDLSGAESVEILADWLRQLLRAHPLMQPHLTLPNAVFSLDIKVGIDMYVGGSVPIASPPDHIDISGYVALRNEVPSFGASGTRPHASAHGDSREREHIQRDERDFHTTVNAAPVPGGQPPDQIRDQHSLPVPRPGYGSRETGSHLFLADIPDVHKDIQTELRRTTPEPPLHAAPDPDPPDLTGGRRGEVADGYVFSAEATTVAPLKQNIPVHNGSVKVDLAGDGIQHAGIHVSAGTHVSSKKVLGDQGGKAYESVNGVYDAGPAGLMRPGRGGGGLGTDGRPRISYGNSHRG